MEFCLKLATEEETMSGSVNRVILLGRAGADPQVKSFDNGGKVVTFSLATSEQWKDQSGQRQERTTWSNIAVWNEALGEVVEKYVKKGSRVYLEGQLETRQYTKDNATQYMTEVTLRPFNSSLQLLDKAPERPTEPPAQSRRGARREPAGRS
jgi:single-strand DNA-binding protein